MQVAGAPDYSSVSGTTILSFGTSCRFLVDHRRPPLAMLEGLCRSLEQPAHLRRARGIWWSKLQTVCLDNQLWDSHSNEVLGMKLVTDTTYRVGSARYLPGEGKTLLTLIDALEGVEIDL
jgi:hypothetical protein